MGIFSGVEEEKDLWGRKNTTFLAILLHSFTHQSFELENGFAEVSLLSCETDLLNYKEIGVCPV